MSNLLFLGNAPAVTDIWTVQVTAYDAATTYKIGVNGKYVTTLAAGSVNATATALAAAWNALTDSNSYSELMQYTATASTDTVTLTAKNPGFPGIVSKAVSGGTGTLGTATNATPATGPAFWDNGANWSTGSAPVNGDKVWIDNGRAILYGLANSGVLLAELDLYGASQIGLPPNNPIGYAEYLDQYLQVGCTLLNIYGSSPLSRFDVGSANACTLNVYSTGTPPNKTIRALTFKGTNAANVGNFFGGNVGIAQRLGETARFASVRIEQGSGGSPDVYFGQGVTLSGSTIYQGGGRFETDSSFVTMLVEAGTFYRNGATTGTTLTVRNGAQFIDRSSGTITTVNVADQGRIDCTQDIHARTYTNLNVYKGAEIDDRFATLTLTNDFTLVQCDLPDVTLRFGANRVHRVT